MTSETIDSILPEVRVDHHRDSMKLNRRQRRRHFAAANRDMEIRTIPKMVTAVRTSKKMLRIC